MIDIHKKILVALAVVLIAYGATYYFLIRPQNQKISSLNFSIEERKTELKQQRITEFDPGRLTVYRESLRKSKIELNQRFRQVYDRAMDEKSTMGHRMAFYGDINVFRNGVTRISYQNAYLQLLSDMEKEGIYLDPRVLGLSEDTLDPNNYRLVAHLWVIEDIARLSKKHGLQINATSADYYREIGVSVDPANNRLPARIRALGVLSYRLSGDSPTFMEEYPVRIKVTGKLSSLTAFLANLTTEDNFMPLSEISISRSEVNAWRRDEVEATLVCSGFLITSGNLKDILPVEIESQMNNLPPAHGGI